MMDIKEILQELKKRLQEVYQDNLKAVILYGSMARGDSTEESDIDILIILGKVDNYNQEADNLFAIQREIEREHQDEIVINTVLVTEDDYNNKREPLYLNAQREGILA